jgi:hypothetical protein|tara:strand:+ start:127 stop:381 length:255 start_codon:yes stop_codon:yes gene_type:complete
MKRKENKMSVVKHNAPLRDVDWFDITYDCPKWGTTGTRVSREQLKTIDGETWYGKHEVITCTKVDRSLIESQAKYHARYGTALD